MIQFLHRHIRPVHSLQLPAELPVITVLLDIGIILVNFRLQVSGRNTELFLQFRNSIRLVNRLTRLGGRRRIHLPHRFVTNGNVQTGWVMIQTYLMLFGVGAQFFRCLITESLPIPVHGNAAP